MPGLERLDRDDVLDAGAHGVAGEALGVGDDDARRRRRRRRRRSALISAAALPPRAGVYVSCDTKTVSGGHGVAVDAARTRPGGPAAPSPGRCASTSSRVPWKALLAVTVPSTSQIGWMPRSRAASADSTTKPRRPCPMIMPCRRRSNGSGGVLDRVVGGGGAGGEEADADPLASGVAGDVVGGDHDDAAAAAGADPVLGQRERLGRARAGRVDLRVRARGRR